MKTAHHIHALRIVQALTSSSTRPLLVETDSGRFVVKLVHGPEGPRALAAEWLSAQLAQLLGLPTLELAPVALDASLAAEILESELREAVERGAGLCLGLRELPGARPATLRELERAPDDFALPLLWLDILIDNPDRRKANPNVLLKGSLLVPIDHAASLAFHHDWEVSEQSPGEALDVPGDHVFAERAASLPAWHAALRARLDRESLTAACDSLPAEWLGAVAFDTPERQRAAYFAMLWKRLRHMDVQLAG